MPPFFSDEEGPDFVPFLTHHAAAWRYRYQVIERASEVAAYAGYAINANGTSACRH
ncbi:hypothetical protein [Xanthomonas arboricola]|uniref:hypothetical protein n=1 Tax=Xanthomonas arboricola TaxID=56448 RepID=UPI00161564BD|nr:hypothetical protein [Xanthomonas arboricola]MBB5677019.1 hypothetical protein [Xanthomonas arboricola]MCC8667869.1 hypothetical protein [Xanthomonas arboricola]